MVKLTKKNIDYAEMFKFDQDEDENKHKFWELINLKEVELAAEMVWKEKGIKEEEVSKEEKKEH